MFDRDGFLLLRDPRIGEIKQDLCARMLPVAENVALSFSEGFAAEPGEQIHAYIDRLCAVETNNRITRALFEVFVSSVELFGLMGHPFFLDLCRQLGIKTPMVWTTPAVRIDRPQEARFLSPAH